MENKKCIFCNEYSGTCKILDYPECIEKNCSFFKPKDDYYLDDDRVPKRKDEYDNG